MQCESHDEAGGDLFPMQRTELQKFTGMQWQLFAS